MAYLDHICYYLSLVCAVWFSQTYSTSIANDRPIHTSIITLLECSFLILSSAKAIPNLFGTRLRNEYNAVPLEDLGDNPSRDESDHTEIIQHPARVRISVVGGIILCISLRLEILRWVTFSAECTIDNVEVYLPFLLAVYDSYRFQKPINEVSGKLDHNVYDSIRARLKSTLLRPRYRYILPSFLLSFGCSILLRLWRPLNSTYICAVASKENKFIPMLQVLGLCLDMITLIVAYEMIPRIDGTGLSTKRNAILWSSSLIGVALVWSIASIIVFMARPDLRTWIMLFDRASFLYTLFEMILWGIGCSILCITILHSVFQIGFLEMVLTLTGIITLATTIHYFWSFTNPFPPTSNWLPTLCLLMMYIGWLAYRKIKQHVTEKKKSSSRITSFIFLVILIFTWFKKDFSHYHPIDLLIYEAEKQHNLYLTEVSHDSNLASAVSRYQSKYNRHPPPGFDIWFQYATNTSALIVDEFDQIYHDLLPFRSIPPSIIRRQTWEMVSNPWNEISGITIRDGVAKVQENVLPTHRWMLEGVAVLINKFAQHLPDMDLAFNLNDEPRVTVPYNIMKHIKSQALTQDTSGAQSWSSNRASGWLPIPEEEFGETVFADASFHNTFEKFGSVACNPSSTARRHHMELPRSHLCTSCTSPHSLGQFVANWSLLNDICHQPDMAHLHGFYLSPAAFKPSYQLMPVFSQSKAGGYDDILYPSAWNYMDKIRYDPSEPKGTPGQEGYSAGSPDPPYSQKSNTLFWRGATSEGVSYGERTWRGMARQRFVHLTSNLTNSQHDQVTVLLPDVARPGKFMYQVISGPNLPNLGLKTDVAIVDSIARCGGPDFIDCHAQEDEFHLVPPTDFQSHWQYRFLFDLDGAGFSGRFIPFLQSRSLPFKTALFREWYDSRITAWKHFVPQDIRLHAVFSTLAYFAGIDGTLNGKPIHWNPHLKEGETIAEEGRNWANKVLRKEDMELYFFRLLLEWGRLTDDNRDNLGFVLN